MVIVERGPFITEVWPQQVVRSPRPTLRTRCRVLLLYVPAVKALAHGVPRRCCWVEVCGRRPSLAVGPNAHQRGSPYLKWCTVSHVSAVGGASNDLSLVLSLVSRLSRGPVGRGRQCLCRGRVLHQGPRRLVGSWRP